MISGIFFYNLSGDLILGRFYKMNMRRVTSEAFRDKILIPKNFTEPVVIIDGCSFMYIRVDNIYVVTATYTNCNVILIFQFMYALTEIFKAYLTAELDEESFRKNFTLIYELLDEVMDNGFPQIVNAELLQEFIKTQSTDLKSYIQRKREERKKKKNNLNKSNDTITRTITGKQDWRPQSNYSYNKNEVYLDVLEKINLLMSKNGDVLQSSANGSVIMKTLLSGTPECRIGINDKLSIDPKAKSHSKTHYIKISDIKLHRSVRLGKFDEDRSICFIPPDGDFELMCYNVSNVNLPFHVFPNIIERGRNRVEYEIKLEAKYSPSMYASDIVMYVPCPDNTNKTDFKVNVGKCKYDPIKSSMVWKIKKLFGNVSALMKGEALLTHLIEDKQWSKPPISMDFEVRMFAASGMKVRYLKVIEPQLLYKTTKWVRYITSAGNYQIRI